MGLYTALNTGATGMNSNQTMLETIGDNIANVNTTAFKSNRADMESQFALTLRGGSAPGQPLGGTNPSQIGLGSAVGAIQRNFTQGQLSSTGVPSDMAIDGQGFFVLDDGSPRPLYTRDGSFSINADQQLVSRDGLQVQGYAANTAGDVDTLGSPSELVIPLGTRTLVEATTHATLDGNLGATDDIAAGGQIQYSQALITDAAAGTPATGGTALTSLVSPTNERLFATGDVIVVQNVLKGALNIVTEPQQFVVGTDGSTVQDLLTHIEGLTAIHTAVDGGGFAETATGDSVLPGISLDALGRIKTVSNVGAVNAVSLTSDNIVNATTGRSLTLFDTPAQMAIGSGVTTQFAVFDSLGETADLRLRLVKESEEGPNTTWRWFAESSADSDTTHALESGTIVFDDSGAFTAAEGSTATIQLADRGASDLAIELDFSAMTMKGDEGASAPEVRVAEINGAPLGTLETFGVDEDGIITGGFTNGLTRTLGQVALATFVNPQGLRLEVSNNYAATDASGAVTMKVPNDAGAGRIQSGSLELSNVELAREFIGLINASTGFSASSRVITTADQLLQELLLIAR
jgi:flagellar hook protein FlgE